MTGLLLYCKKDETDEPDQLLIGWVGGTIFDGYGVILHTTDGGKNWTRQGSIDVLDEANIDYISAVSEDIVWACGTPVNGKPSIFKTIDRGENWERIGGGKNIPVVEYGGIDGIGNNIAWAVGNEGVIIKTTDGGANWTRQDDGTLTKNAYDGISVVDENHVWISGTFYGDQNQIAIIYHTSDGGQNWYRQAENYIPAQLDGFIDIHACSPNDAWAVGTGDGAIRTKDGGQTWEVMDPPGGGLNHNNGVCMVDKDNIWIAPDDGVRYYSEATGKWEEFNLDIDPAAIWPVTIGATALSKDTVWMVTSAGGNVVQGEIFYTENGGSSWKKQNTSVVSSFRRITFPKGVR